MARAHKGRGALTNRSSRFQLWARHAIDDGWQPDESAPAAIPTTVEIDRARRVISYNDSPDIPFDRSINPYRGCEHGCIYCYARPSHAYLGLSPGLDFESRLFHKPDAPRQLRHELSAPRYRPAPICLGANTDPYQPLERRLGDTRRILEVLAQYRHPVRIVTKSALIERDIVLLKEMAQQQLVSVSISLTTLDRRLTRAMEPRATAPERRLRTIEKLSQAAIAVTVLTSPIIPALNDHELETLLTRGREAGAQSAGYSIIRLPLEIQALFTEWLETHFPQRSSHVLARIRELHGGKAYRSVFGERMRGHGVFAELLAQRFRIATKRLGFTLEPTLRCDRFRPPRASSAQLELF